MCDTATTSDGNLLSETQKQYLNTLGDFDCNGFMGQLDLVNMIDEYLDTGRYGTQLLVDYIDIYLNENEINTRNSLLESIKNGTYTPGSCTTDGCTGSVTPQPQSQTTMERARIELSDSDSTRLRIANIPNNENPNNYDIFFKGKEVLEYKANLNGVGTLDNNQIDPIFKNLFNPIDYTDNGYKNHIINGNQLYHARKASLDGDWETDTVYKIFSNCNFKIESIDSIRYHDTTESNETRVENIGPEPDGTQVVEILSPPVTL
tara:strand:- start:466 stop:1251 length:786 start_codon:yes stop_codon:yes gene_type:complete